MRDVESWLKSSEKLGHTEPGTTLSFDGWFGGRYEIERLLGIGTTAAAFLATDTVIERQVVLKIRHGHNSVPRDMFIDEARTLGRVQHPNLVKIYDFGESPVPYMALEFLGPTTVRTLLRDHVLAHGWTSETANIAHQVSALLRYLHDSALVFQLDLKPENLAIDRETLTVRMMDFGAVVPLHQGWRRWHYGTPGYLAPEMFVNEPLTSAADIFGFGAVLYELVTGLRPFQEVQAASVQNLPRDWFGMATSVRFDFEADRAAREARREQREHVHRAMRAFIPSAGLPPHLPKPLVSLLESTLAFDPKRRPSAMDVHLAMESLLPQPTDNQRTSVFISHAHQDKARFVSDFAAALKAKGFDVWIDEWSLHVGDSFWDRIGAALEHSQFIIIVLSQHSLTSRGVAEELRTAQTMNLDSTQKLLPIRIDPVDFKSIPVSLRSRHVLDFVGWQDKERFEKLVAKLAADILVLRAQRNTE